MKYLSILMRMAMVAVMLVQAQGVSAVKFTKNGVNYSTESYLLNKGEVKVMGVDPNLLELTIPQYVNYDGKTYAVVSIDYDAFKNNRTLTRLTIPGNIKCLYGGRFENCTALESVTIGGEAIRKDAFKGCTRLKEAIVSNNPSVWNGAFPEGVRIVGRYCEVAPMEKITVSQLMNYVDPYKSNINISGRPIVLFTSWGNGCRPVARERMMMPEYLARQGITKRALAVEVDLENMSETEKGWMKTVCEKTGSGLDSVPYTVVILPDGRVYAKNGFIESFATDAQFGKLREWIEYCR